MRVKLNNETKQTVTQKLHKTNTKHNKTTQNVSKHNKNQKINKRNKNK